MDKTITINLKVRRYDLKDDPDFEDVSLDINNKLEYSSLKKLLYSYFDVKENKCVLKLRNFDHCLLPLGDILKEENSYFILDITKINYTDNHKKAANNQIRTLLERLNRLEELAKDIEWRKQASAEEDINILTDRMEFLNRRYDLLLPSNYTLKQHLQ